VTEHQATLIAVTAAVVFLMLLPIIIISSTSRKPLEIAAFLLCAISVATLLAGLFFGTAVVFSFFVSIPIAAGLWFAGFLCALASWADACHERRTREMTLRLLTNDAIGLGEIKHSRSRWL
jgi:hypothetical protein